MMYPSLYEELYLTRDEFMSQIKISSYVYQ